MRAMILDELTDLSQNPAPLRPAELPPPEPGEGEVLVHVTACGVCHTELDEIEGRTPPSKFPAILGHQVVGTIEGSGKGAFKYAVGQRVGIGWIFDSCGECGYCLSGDENLCEKFKATGRDVPGGYAEYMTVPEDSAFPIPSNLTDTEAAPLLCAGAIGYRSLRLTGLKDGQLLGLTGFGSSAHLVLKTARYLYPNARVFVFTRRKSEQEFALELGADWAGYTDSTPPVRLNAIIDTTPAWKPVVEALRFLAPGGRLVINAIRKEHYDQQVLSDIDYTVHLWMEKEIKSIANVSRRDVREFLNIAGKVPIRPEIQDYSLFEANKALMELKTGKIRGAKVLIAP